MSYYRYSILVLITKTKFEFEFQITQFSCNYQLPFAQLPIAIAN